MDMPKLHEYMSQYLTPLIASGKITLAEIGKNPQLEGCVVDLMSPAPSKMFAAILKDLEAKEVCVCLCVSVFASVSSVRVRVCGGFVGVCACVPLAEIGKNPQLEGYVVDLVSPAPSKMFAAILKDLEAKEVCVRVRVRVRVYFCISNCDRGGRAGQILMLRNGLLLVCLGVRSLKHRW